MVQQDHAGYGAVGHTDRLLSDIEAAFNQQLYLASIALPDGFCDPLMRESRHGETSVGDANAPVFVSHDLIGSFNTEAVSLVAGSLFPGALNASMQDELVNCPHSIETGQHRPTPCQLGLCSRRLFEGYLFQLFECVRRVQGITASRVSGVQSGA